MILRTIKCNICNEQYTETECNAGFPGWGIIQGKKDDKGNTDFHLCPKHLDLIFDYIKGIE